MAQRVALFACVLIALCALVGYVLTRPKAKGRPFHVEPIPQLAAPSDYEAGYHTPLPRPMVRPHLLIFKAAHRLELYCEDKLLRVYPVGLGMNGSGHKRRQWDLCTPEGNYYICAKNPNSKYFLALVLSYPNAADAERALAEGLITKSQHDDIVSAIQRGSCPPRNTPLGGDIVIHGRGSGADWTAGCVALDDDNMRELFEGLPVGTAVEIRP